MKTFFLIVVVVEKAALWTTYETFWYPMNKLDHFYLTNFDAYSRHDLAKTIFIPGPLQLALYRLFKAQAIPQSLTYFYLHLLCTVGI